MFSSGVERPYEMNWGQREPGYMDAINQFYLVYYSKKLPYCVFLGTPPNSPKGMLRHVRLR
jgi:hypothetical protein